MVLSSIISPLEIEAKTGTTDRQSVEWNGKNCEYEVILPAGYNPDSGFRYPVMYLLPEDGLGEYPEEMERTLEETMSGEKGIDMILVKPVFTMDMDVRQVMDLVAADVDANYNTIPGAGNRAVVGTGIGGYLAYILGLTETKQADAGEAEETVGSEENPVTETEKESREKADGESQNQLNSQTEEKDSEEDRLNSQAEEKKTESEHSNPQAAEKESEADRSDLNVSVKGSDAEQQDLPTVKKVADTLEVQASDNETGTAEVRESEKGTGTAEVQESEKGIGTVEVQEPEKGIGTAEVQEPEKGIDVAETQEPEKETGAAKTQETENVSDADMSKKQEKEENQITEKSGENAGTNTRNPDSGNHENKSNADMPETLESDNKALAGTPLTQPGTFGMIASV